MAAVDDTSLLLEEEKLQHNSSMRQLFSSARFLVRSMFLSAFGIVYPTDSIARVPFSI